MMDNVFSLRDRMLSELRCYTAPSLAELRRAAALTLESLESLDRAVATVLTTSSGGVVYRGYGKKTIMVNIWLMMVNNDYLLLV